MSLSRYNLLDIILVSDTRTCWLVLKLRIYDHVVVVLQSFIDEVRDNILDENETSRKKIFVLEDIILSRSTYPRLFPAFIPILLFTRGKK
jgi:hypothetical protein